MTLALVPFNAAAPVIAPVGAAIAGRLARRAVDSAADMVWDRVARRKRRNREWPPPAPAIPRRLRGSVRYGGFYNRYGGDKELKFHDLNITDASASSAGEIFEDSIFEIPAGTGESARIGREICVKKISCRGDITFTGQTTANANNDVVRVLWYLDRSANGAAPNVGDILEHVNVHSFYNLANTKRFRILSDKFLYITSTGAYHDGVSHRHVPVIRRYRFTKRFKGRGLKVDYSGVTGALTELCCNAVGILLISNAGHCRTTIRIRVRYTG